MLATLLSLPNTSLRFAAGALVLCFGVSPALAMAPELLPPSPNVHTQVIVLPEATSSVDKPLLLAHHGGESAGTAAVTVTSSSSVLALDNTSTHNTLSDSLWVNLILSMAYQRDPQVRKYAKRLNRVNNITLLSVAGISALGLAQSISSLNNLHGAETIEIEDHEGHGGHFHTKADSKTPATLGIIGSSATLATLGIKAVLDQVYSGRLSKRQLVIKDQVEALVTRLKQGEVFDTVADELSQLIGPLATSEFHDLWLAVHPVSK